MMFCADGFRRIFSHFPGIWENWENYRKIADELRGFFIFSPRFQFSRQRYDALQILVGRGMSNDVDLDQDVNLVVLEVA